MTSVYVDWGESKVKLTWVKDNKLPQWEFITSVHGFCFYRDKVLLVDLNHRGWDFPGGHMEPDETPEKCFGREAMEEGYVEGISELLGYIIVDHSENSRWIEKSPYPLIGYQVFYKMNITNLHPFKGKFESLQRIFINPADISSYCHEWHALYQEIIDYALQ